MTCKWLGNGDVLLEETLGQRIEKLCCRPNRVNYNATISDGQQNDK